LSNWLDTSEAHVVNESTQGQLGRGSRWLGLVAMFGCGWWRWSPQAVAVAEVLRLVGLLIFVFVPRFGYVVSLRPVVGLAVVPIAARVLFPLDQPGFGLVGPEASTTTGSVKTGYGVSPRYAVLLCPLLEFGGPLFHSFGPYRFAVDAWHVRDSFVASVAGYDLANTSRRPFVLLGQGRDSDSGGPGSCDSDSRGLWLELVASGWWVIERNN
jgi:hypothetical protein